MGRRCFAHERSSGTPTGANSCARQLDETLDEKTLKKLRRWYSCCPVSTVSITGRTHREEAGADGWFDVTATIRAQRLEHLGNVLRLSDDESLKIVVNKLTKTEDGECPAGSTFMDTPEHADARRLCDLANDAAGGAKHVDDAFPTKKHDATEPPTQDRTSRSVILAPC